MQGSLNRQSCLWLGRGVRSFVSSPSPCLKVQTGYFCSHTICSSVVGSGSLLPFMIISVVFPKEKLEHFALPVTPGYISLSRPGRIQLSMLRCFYAPPPPPNESGYSQMCDPIPLVH